MSATSRPVSLQFLGAAGTVTGSRFLVTAGPSRLLVDCGMFQGDRALRRRNWAPFPVPPDRIDAVLLTHAHLDHTGWLPRLVRQGFAGPVFCSPWTARVAPIVLRDAAHLQEEDARHAAGHGYSRHREPLPLFDTADADRAVALLRPVPFHRDRLVAPGLTVRLQPAGHILGSATVRVRAGDRSLGFSGDLGRDDHPLLAGPDPAPAVDAMVVESTYGDRAHPPRDPERLAAPIRRALARGGVVIIPAFAIDRTEVLLMALRDLMSGGALPVVPVFVDSPMALAAMQVYRQAVRDGAPEIRPGIRALPADPFDPGDLRLASTAHESARLNDPPAPCILLSASGMATGGRVVHHLAALAPDPRNLILLPGYQVAGTRGRSLRDGARALKMYGGYVPVRAEVVGVGDMSAHADADGLVAWLKGAPAAPRTCYVVHGEPAASAALAARIDRELGWCAVTPRDAERVLV
ncbi:MBL fold metallo-hydrolase RNA specificity domain-containing protein [Spirilliplanes yamanashiensis]|uniref:MBL fold metallo-hydrolase n=1 Tax=Spirilliplanes yamanashiensis TaxID=42233 RepID=A0A8J3YF17_9ACTN|nr:MBL fold metallo-hydrolase [Spirilliplanes yamanashiensis]MDP9818228.1 metallo-beta-lactamase family protein [Spirilliplanes yamanashiensis]GIJ06744.1 MBL fold metallo-hydrolase [Spirilliplanes yamanashiensis]